MRTSTEERLAGIVVIEPRVFRDRRGCFAEFYQQPRYQQLGVPSRFVQGNFSVSQCNTIRGLHYQYPRAQGKLLWVLQGKIYDVAVDMREWSPTFGRWTSFTLDAEDYRQVYIPPGFAHGFCVLSDDAELFYKCTELYHPTDEQTVSWDDAELDIPWPLNGEPIISAKDDQGVAFRDAPKFTRRQTGS